MTPQQIFATLDAAGVYIADFARLTGISRPALNRWKREGNADRIRDKLRYRIACDLAVKVARATEAGKLPLKDPLKLTERVAVLRRILS